MYTTVQKQEVYAWINCLTKYFKICHIFGIQKPKVAAKTLFVFYATLISKWSSSMSYRVFIRGKTNEKTYMKHFIQDEFFLLKSDTCVHWVSTCMPSK